MIDVFEIGASLNVHGNGMDFMKAFSGALTGAHGQIEALEKKIGAAKGAMKDLFIGAGEVFAGAEILKGITHLAEAGKELNHQQSMLMRNGVSQRDVMRETSAIYKDMLTTVPTASAVDFLRTLGELKTVKGSIAGAREALTQSLKIEGLIGNSTGKSAEGQGYDFWRAAEDKGVIQNKEKTDALLNRMVQGTIATQGKMGGGDWFTYARRAGSAWMGDDIESMPLQLMEMQTLGASGAGVARRAFANRIEGAIKLTKAQKEGWNQIGMLGPNGTVKDAALEQSRPDLFLQKTIDALKAHGIDTEAKVKMWSAHALHGKDADYFNSAYLGMTEVDPESGLTRLQKERRNMGEAQPLDKAYQTMMGTDFEANMHALQEQWKSFTEAVGGPAAKAMIPVLQGVTSFVTSMANFADQNQKLTQFGVDIAAAAGGLLALGGSLRLLRGSLRLMGGGLFGMGRSALGLGPAATTMASAGEMQLNAARMMLEAAGGHGGGLPGGGSSPGSSPGGSSPGYTSLMPGAVALAYQLYELAQGAPDQLRKLQANPNKDVADPNLEWAAKAGDYLRHLFGVGSVSSGGVPLPPRRPDALGANASALHPDDDRATRARASDSEAWRQQQDMMKAASQQFGELKDRTGFVLTSFEGLNTKSGGLNGTFGVLEATALGAARALAQVAMSGGGMGGGSGVINASYGGGGGFGGGGMSPLMRGTGGGGGYAPGGLGALSAGRVTGSILSRGDDAMRHLMSIGVSREAAAAIVGNAQQESSITGHGPAGDHGTAHGMFQWRFDRFSALQRFAAARGKPWQDEHTELEFMVTEARKRGGAGWLTGHDVYAANQGMQRFEQYGESRDHGNFRTRLGNAHMWLGRQGSTISAGRPAMPAVPAGEATQAMNMPPIVIEFHHRPNLNGKELAHEVTRHQVADARFKRSVGATDNYGRRAHPGSEVMDA